MRAEALLSWAIFTLCCALLCAGEDAQGDKASRDLGQVRRPRGVLERGGQVEEEEKGAVKKGAVPMSDEPVEPVEAEQAKPKKKKTPEEIEAGKLLSWDGTNTGDVTAYIFLEKEFSWHICSLGF